jgi:hypothetical protein
MLLTSWFAQGLGFTAIDVALKIINYWLRRGRGYIAPLMKIVAKIGLTMLLTALLLFSVFGFLEVILNPVEI